MPHPAVIFIHGLRSSCAIWSQQVRVAEQYGYVTRAVDLPGHGANRGQTFTFAGAFREIDHAIASLPNPAMPVVLVGLSLGGYTTLAYTATHPHVRVVGVLAAACSTDPAPLPVAAYRDVAAAVAGATGWLRTALRRETSRSASRPGLAAAPSPASLPAQPPSLPVSLPDDVACLPWTVVTEALTELRDFSSRGALRGIEVPVLLVNGQFDHLRLGEQTYRAVQPGVTLTVIPGAGHDVNQDDPVRFNRALVTFLDACSASAASPTHAASPAHSAPLV